MLSCDRLLVWSQKFQLKLHADKEPEFYCRRGPGVGRILLRGTELGKNSRKTQVTVAIIGLIGVLGAAAIANWDKIFPERSANQTAQKTGEQLPVTPTTSGSQGPEGARISGCFEQYFSRLPGDRIAILEAGVKDFQIIGPHQSKEQIIAIHLQENRQPIGGLKFHFYSNNTIFKIESVVGSKCQPVEEYANATRGGDKHILQNWDELQLRLGNAAYTLSIAYGAGMIDADFARTSPVS